MNAYTSTPSGVQIGLLHKLQAPAPPPVDDDDARVQAALMGIPHEPRARCWQDMALYSVAAVALIVAIF